MSIQYDINQSFKELIEKHPDIEKDILYCKFNVCGSMYLDDLAIDTIKEIQKKGYEIDGTMTVYLEIMRKGEP